MNVVLTPQELMIAATVGVMRQITNLRDCRRDAHGAEAKYGWQYHIEGACGECAVAKACGAYWNGNLGNLKADDVGRLQVRAGSGEDYRLIIHDTDPDERKFVLVVGLAPRYRLCGWLYGREGKRPEFWTDPVGQRPAYFIPQSLLHPIDLDVLREGMQLH